MATMTEVRALLTQLDGLGVTVPAEVAPLLAAHDRISDLGAYTARPAVALTDLAPSDIVQWTTLRLAGEEIKETRAQASDMLAASCADHLAENADRIIDQLRPTFDAAAAHFTAARKAGITERTSPADVLAMPTGAATAWRPLATNARALAAVASARIAMSRTLGIAPDSRQTPQAYGACFAQTRAAWDGNESSVATWLRLAASGLELQPVRTTAALTRIVPVPLVPA